MVPPVSNNSRVITFHLLVVGLDFLFSRFYSLSKLLEHSHHSRANCRGIITRSFGHWLGTTSNLLFDPIRCLVLILQLSNGVLLGLKHFKYNLETNTFVSSTLRSSTVSSTISAYTSLEVCAQIRIQGNMRTNINRVDTPLRSFCGTSIPGAITFIFSPWSPRPLSPCVVVFCEFDMILTWKQNYWQETSVNSMLYQD